MSFSLRGKNREAFSVSDTDARVYIAELHCRGLCFEEMFGYCLYPARSGFVNFDLLRLCQIDPHPHPACLVQGFVCRNQFAAKAASPASHCEASQNLLVYPQPRFYFVSLSRNSQNLSARGITALLLSTTFRKEEGVGFCRSVHSKGLEISEGFQFSWRNRQFFAFLQEPIKRLINGWTLLWIDCRHLSDQ